MDESTCDVSECPECGSSDLKTEDEDEGEVFCRECGYVVGSRTSLSDGQESKEGGNKSNFSEEIQSRRSAEQIEEIDEQDSLWWDHDPAIFALMSPDDTHQEFYRIDNPEDFFDGIQGENEMTNRIRESGVEPFQKIEVPYIDWRFSI